jgi:hypothetical protein
MLAMQGTEILLKSLEILLQNLPESLPAEDSPDFQNIYDNLLPRNWAIDSNVLKRMNGDEVAAFVETLERIFESDFETAVVEHGPSLGYVVGHLAEYLERYPEHPLITGFL